MIFNSLKKKISWRVRNFYSTIIAKYSSQILFWSTRSPRRSSFYYFAFSNKFDREHYSVLKAKLAHINKDDNSLSFDATLRRNIHRLEKGLTTMPLRNSFAKDYIEETVSSYEFMLKSSADFKTVKWARDVLSKYFSIVEQTSSVVKANKKFLDLEGSFKFHDTGTVPSLPFARKDSVLSDISYEQFNKLCMQRRSIRWYTQEKVPHELIDKALSATLYSPSACNRQPFRFVIIEDPEMLKVAANLPMGTSTFSHNIPMMAILIGDLSAYSDERDRHIIYIDGGLAAMSFMFALETLGLSSCPINWPDVEYREKSLDKFLQLSPFERCVMFISIGFPLEDGQIPFSQKKSINTILSKI